MKRQIGKRLLCALLTLVMVLSLVPVTAAAAELVRGYCGAEGENVTWMLDDAGTLTISGIGAMKNYGNVSEIPWASYLRQINKVIVKAGVSTIGNNAFYKSSVASVELAGTVKDIHTCAFWDCDSLTSIVFPEGLETIGFDAFSSVAI